VYYSCPVKDSATQNCNHREGCSEGWVMKGVESRKEHESKHGRHPTTGTLGATRRADRRVLSAKLGTFALRREPTPKSLFHRLSPGCLQAPRSFCLREASGGGRCVGRQQQSRQSVWRARSFSARVRAACRLTPLTPNALSFSGSHSNAAGESLQRRGAANSSRRAGTGRVCVLLTRVCTVHARML